MTTVERRHRDTARPLAEEIIAGNYAREYEPDEKLCADTVELHLPFVTDVIAQAIADTEQQAYERGYRDGVNFSGPPDSRDNRRGEER